MSIRTCETCAHHKLEYIAERPDHRCLRILSWVDGTRTQNSSVVAELVWRSFSRAEGDLCTPERKHWVLA